MNELNLDAEIRRITEETLKDGTIEDIIRKNVHDSIARSINESFSYGALSTAIRKRIEDTMVPYIEKYDMSEYVPKLDAILCEIIQETRCSDAKKILSNFKTIMKPPTQKTIKFVDIFAAYCNYAAANCETDGRNVNYDSGEPMYEEFECRADIDNTNSEWSIFDRINVDLIADIEPEYNDPLNLTFTLRRLKNTDHNYTIECEIDPRITSLTCMSDFQAYLLALSRAGTEIEANSVEDLSEYITPAKEPDITFK